MRLQCIWLGIRFSKGKTKQNKKTKTNRDMRTGPSKEMFQLRSAELVDRTEGH